MKITANEFIFPIQPDIQCHASHILPLENNELFCVFFYGSQEGNTDVRIFGSLRGEDGKWTEPAPISEDDGIPHWNPVLHRLKDGSVQLFYKVGHTIPNWVTYCKLSRDNCRTWSDPFPLVPDDTSGGRGPVRNKILNLPDGTLLAPGSTEQGEWVCFFDRSEDDGQHWNRSSDIRIFSNVSTDSPETYRRGIIQPSLWQSEAGIHALLRSSEGTIFRTDSKDGIIWCKPYSTGIPNNNSGLDLAQISDGRILLCCNPVSENWGARTPLSLYISHDNGKFFELFTHLNTTADSEFSYPALVY